MVVHVVVCGCGVIRIQKTQQGVFYFVGTSASDPEKRLRRPTNNDVEDDYEYRE